MIDITTLRFEHRCDAERLVNYIFKYGVISMYDYYRYILEPIEDVWTSVVTIAYKEDEIDKIVRYRDGYGITLKNKTR